MPLKETAKANPDAKVVFLGDSISQGLTGHEQRVSKPGGGRAIDEAFGDLKAISFGLSGDRTEHLIWRLRNGQLDGLKPEWVVVMIGVNNINAGGHTGEETAEGTALLTEEIRSAVPDAQVLLLGCFPPGALPSDG